MAFRAFTLKVTAFPFLFGGTFIEGASIVLGNTEISKFPFLFGGTFIEGSVDAVIVNPEDIISLPFRRDFH